MKISSSMHLIAFDLCHSNGLHNTSTFFENIDDFAKCFDLVFLRLFCPDVHTGIIEWTKQEEKQSTD